MFRYMGRYKFAVLLVVIFAVGSTIFSIIGPKILGNATTELFNGLISKVSGGSGINFDEIARILPLAHRPICRQFPFCLYPGYHHDPSHPKTTYRLRRDMAAKINRLPMKFFDSKQHGEVLSLVTNDIDTISNGLNQSAPVDHLGHHHRRGSRDDAFH